MDTAPQSKATGHLSDTEIQYFEAYTEYIGFIIVARTWGEKCNPIIRKKWHILKIAAECLSPTDTLLSYLPMIPLVLNVGVNLGVDTEEEIACMLQHMLLKELCKLIHVIPSFSQEEKEEDEEEKQLKKTTNSEIVKLLETFGKAGPESGDDARIESRCDLPPLPEVDHSETKNTEPLEEIV